MSPFSDARCIEVAANGLPPLARVNRALGALCDPGAGSITFFLWTLVLGMSLTSLPRVSAQLTIPYDVPTGRAPTQTLPWFGWTEAWSQKASGSAVEGSDIDRQDGGAG